MMMAALALSAVAADAGAQPRTLAGAWVLETAPHKVTGCVIRGTADATPARSGFDLQVHIKETCPDHADFVAEETCRAVAAGARVTMRCTVVRATPENYNADAFLLEWRGADMMVGRLADGEFWDEPVTWRRPAPALVS